MGHPGRPPALFVDDKTLNIIEGLAKIQCTQAEAAGVLGVSRDSLHNFFKDHPDVRDRWDNGLEGGKASIRRNQFKLCETNATMAIWLGKQYLGQRDQNNLEMSGRLEIPEITDADRAKVLAGLIAKMQQQSSDTNSSPDAPNGPTEAHTCGVAA
jgi:hypothetical protein